MKNTLVHFLEKHTLSTDDTIIVGCSGGPDSMYLLHQLLSIYPTENIIVAHVNHGTRSGESTDDEHFVRDYCTKNKLLIEVLSVDIAKEAEEIKQSIETTARNTRYTFFESIRKKHHATAIFIAHHLDDQVETIISRMVKWAKIHGLQWIKEKNRCIYRPLLHTKKSDILAYLKEQNIEYKHDKTNDIDNFDRNHIRLNIAPEFTRLNSEYRRSFDSLAIYMQELTQWIDNWITSMFVDNSFHIDDFLHLPSFLQKEMIRYMYAECNDGTIGLSSANIQEVIRFIKSPHGDTHKHIKQMYLYKKSGIITFEKK